MQPAILLMRQRFIHGSFVINKRRSDCSSIHLNAENRNRLQ
ncbi:hypothetical protein UUU_04360 [Klebsiella pneumoniae subsp. pneumoniae DSM 30104 = JCM 1662 = NBRC 14940]|nr:hypothetical protein UUU_04360 [Klebsiella pneumoniae subsp. pneumoniae DSM 30104 = JCM 1662 = NBRC 14940]